MIEDPVLSLPLEVFAFGFPGVLPVGPPCLRFSLRLDITARKIGRFKGLKCKENNHAQPFCFVLSPFDLPPKTPKL